MQLCRGAQAIAVLVAAAVGGCGTSGGGVVRGAGTSSAIATSEAFITPPPGGPAIIAVLETRYRNGLAQDIVLDNNSSTAGQNVILLRAYGPMGRDAGTTDLAVDGLGLGDVSRELARRFPGVRMEVSGLYAQNKYGAFSYATGRSASGANCLYAWQRIAAEPRVFSFKRGSVTWRLRVCDDAGDMRSLLLLAYGLTINGYFLSQTWDPYAVPEADPRIGAPGVTIFPEQVVDPTVVPPVAYGEGARSGRPRVRRPSSRRTRAASPPSFVAVGRQEPTVLNQPVEGAAIIPRPESTDLSEPRVERSNLPQTGAPSGSPRPAVPIPVPPAPPQGFRPTSQAPASAAPASAAPRVSTGASGGSSVRVVAAPQ